MVSGVFSFLFGGGSSGGDSNPRHEPPPSVKIVTDRKAYRPLDHVVATIELGIEPRHGQGPLVVESLVVAFKGFERLDPQWILIRPGLPQRRGERAILESSPTTIVSGVMLEQGTMKTYVVRMLLPKILPPSYKGTAVHYFYYAAVHLKWAPACLENGLRSHVKIDTVDVQTTFSVWTMPNSSGLTSEEMQTKEYWGIVPKSPVQVEISWKEKDDEGDWIRTADAVSLREDDYTSQTGTCIKKGGLNMSFDRMFQLPTPASSPRGGSRESSFRRSEDSNQFLLRQSSVCTESHLDGLEEIPPKIKSKFSEADGLYDTLSDARTELGIPVSPSAQCIRGRSYNIKFDDRVLLRFTPKNSDLTYYFGDVIGGVLSFLHDDEGSRRCLEVSAVLEIREILNPSSLHPSRKKSPVITKVKAEYHEIVADMLETHFIFSIPPDGPPSFATPQVSIQWVLRFEFVAVAHNVGQSKYEHPLLIKEKEKGEWSVPLTVHAPLQRAQLGARRKERISQKADSWSAPSTPSGKRIDPISFPPARV